MTKWPCEECVCLAICLCKIERHSSTWMVSSLSKNCEIIGDYLFEYNTAMSTRDRIKYARKFYSDRKDKNEVSM